MVLCWLELQGSLRHEKKPTWLEKTVVPAMLGGTGKTVHVTTALTQGVTSVATKNALTIVTAYATTTKSLRNQRTNSGQL